MKESSRGGGDDSPSLKGRHLALFRTKTALLLSAHQGISTLGIISFITK